MKAFANTSMIEIDPVKIRLAVADPEKAFNALGSINAAIYAIVLLWTLWMKRKK